MIKPRILTNTFRGISTLGLRNRGGEYVWGMVNNMIVEVFRHTAANVNFHIKTVTKEADSKTAPRAVKEKSGGEKKYESENGCGFLMRNIFCEYTSML